MAGGAHLRERRSLPGSQGGHFHAWLGRPRCRDWGARSCGAHGELRGKGAARGARPGVQGKTASRPPRARSRERRAQTGCPVCPGRVPAAAARGRSRRGGGLARGVLPPSEPERKCGGPDWGPARLGRTGRASKTRGPPQKLLALLRAPPRGRPLGAAKARAPCGPRGPPRLGGVSEGPLKEGVRGGGGHSLLTGVETQEHAAHTRDQWSLRKPTRTCLGSPRAPPSCFLCYVSD